MYYFNLNMEVFGMRKELRVGIILQATYLALNRFFNIPDFISGFFIGLGLFLIVIGILPEKTYGKIKQLKGIR